MRKIFHIALFICLMVCPATVVLTSCSSDTPESPVGKKAVLVLNVGTVGNSRAAADADNERMHSLRIILVSESGKVEYNEHVDFATAVEEHTHRIAIDPGLKKVYLIANEESVTYGNGASLHDYLESVAIGSADFTSTIESISFIPDYTKNIPLTSQYELVLKPGENEPYVFYVVRVATKFTLCAENHRKSNVAITGMTIDRIADMNYLMPHVGDNGTLFDGYPTWLDWLKKVSDDSQNDPYNPSPDDAGWLKIYDLPGAATHSVFAVNDRIEVPAAVTEGTATTPGTGRYVFYCPESKNMLAGTADYEQSYTMTVSVEGVDTPFSFTLPNLKALFRNTHVMVNLRFADKQHPVIYAGIVYWGLHSAVTGIVEEEP